MHAGNDLDLSGTPVGRLNRMVRHPDVPRLVEAFFTGGERRKGESGFAGLTFLDLPNNHPHAISAEDLLAVSLLDVAFGPSAVRSLLFDSAYQTRVSTGLTDIPHDRPLWEVDNLDAAHTLWDTFQELPKVGYVKAGKLLARKRPHLIPIVDQVVERLVQAPSGEYWSTFRDFFEQADSKEAVQRLIPPGVTENVPLLRIVDAAIWMMGSDSEPVQRVRQDVVDRADPLF